MQFILYLQKLHFICLLVYTSLKEIKTTHTVCIISQADLPSRQYEKSIPQKTIRR